LWPGTGAATETAAYDNALNIPFPPETDGAAMRSVYTQTVFPRLREFAPELILVSAGFDAHRDDPLAQLNWDTEDFQWLGRELCAVAREICQGRLVSVLEGGYDLRALAASAKVFVNELIEAANE
jgi:acetoin utilization deacetylase AcuC-like enzyme